MASQPLRGRKVAILLAPAGSEQVEFTEPKKAVRDAGADVVGAGAVGDVGAALAAGDELGYPAVLKPTLGASSNFVFRVDSPADMRTRFAQATAGMHGISWQRMEAAGVDLGPVQARLLLALLLPLLDPLLERDATPRRRHLARELHAGSEFQAPEGTIAW